MRILEIDPARLDTPQLKELVAALQRAENDFQARVAAQATALESAGRMHENEPVYQTLVFAWRKYRQQLSRAEQELSRRAALSTLSKAASDPRSLMEA
jgi:hypothetical protein